MSLYTVYAISSWVLSMTQSNGHSNGSSGPIVQAKFFPRDFLRAYQESVPIERDRVLKGHYRIPAEDAEIMYNTINRAVDKWFQTPRDAIGANEEIDRANQIGSRHGIYII